jgi:hypothetical protein
MGTRRLQGVGEEGGRQRQQIEGQIEVTAREVLSPPLALSFAPFQALSPLFLSLS